MGLKGARATLAHCFWPPLPGRNLSSNVNIQQPSQPEPCTGSTRPIAPCFDTCMYPPPRVARTALGEIVSATLATSALDLTTVRASARDRACYACHLCARAQSAMRSSAARAEMTDLDNEITYSTEQALEESALQHVKNFANTLHAMAPKQGGSRGGGTLRRPSVAHHCNKHTLSRNGASGALSGWRTAGAGGGWGGRIGEVISTASRAVTHVSPGANVQRSMLVPALPAWARARTSRHRV
jgi:hypothetical protein